MPAAGVEKPEKVVHAIRLFYVIIAIGVARLVLMIIRHFDVRTPDMIIVTKVLWYAACIFVLYQLGQGKNWARWVMVALFIGSIPLAILPAVGEIGHNPANALLTFLQAGLYLVALVLLFNRNVSGWFGTGR